MMASMKSYQFSAMKCRKTEHNEGMVEWVKKGMHFQCSLQSKQNVDKQQNDNSEYSQLSTEISPVIEKFSTNI